MFSDAEIGVFLDELDEKIQVLNDGFLTLEREGQHEATIQEIFRAAHTVKGSSAIMGYDRMSGLTHEMENLFDRIRQGRLQVTSQMVDVLFEALDTLKALREEIIEGGAKVDIAPVIGRLRAFEDGGAAAVTAVPGAAEADSGPPEAPGAADLTESEVEVIREALLVGLTPYRITVRLDPGCQMKAARAFLVFRNLEEMGEAIRSVPPAEVLQDGRFDDVFEVILLSREDPDRIHNQLMTIAEVFMVLVEPVVLPEGPAAVTTDTAEGPAEKAAAGAGPGNGHAEHRQTVRTVRIDVEKLDTLMNLVGELVIERTRLDRFARVVENRLGNDEMIETLEGIANHLGQVTNDLQVQIMKARMLPIAQVFNRFPRMVRDLAHKLGKEIDLVIEGRETELDRNVIEVIGDPLLHLVRNAIDHGIEPPDERVRLGKPRTGVLRLRACHQENNIVIRVEDDGRGMDPEALRRKAVEKGLIDEETARRMRDADALQLIFVPGFSTAENVTDLSGRGVGGDVVKNQIESFGGNVDVESTPGTGSRFTIKLPLTLAIIRALIVDLAGQVYAFPLVNVQEIIQFPHSEIRMVGDNEVVVVRGSVLPLVRLGRLFGHSEKDEEKTCMVIIGTGESRVGVVVDGLLGEQEIVIKSLGDLLGRIPGLSGATILGDGRVALIVDVRALVREITRKESVRELAYEAG
ncbi:MAG: chemotaxis protein CheA [Thermoanaerobacterales bacterium]|nr:chemotaxis protein CheA [Bacillota bacterium]MDI6906167.1 chemotaxis protein CheA [Thermoanaerobacterales bacterium]